MSEGEDAAPRALPDASTDAELVRLLNRARYRARTKLSQDDADAGFVGSLADAIEAALEKAIGWQQTAEMARDERDAAREPCSECGSRMPAVVHEQDCPKVLRECEPHQDEVRLAASRGVLDAFASLRNRITTLEADLGRERAQNESLGESWERAEDELKDERERRERLEERWLFLRGQMNHDMARESSMVRKDVVALMDGIERDFPELFDNATRTGGGGEEEPPT
jgi:hypothetical protein